MKDNGRMRDKGEIISSLEEMRAIARTNKRLFKINVKNGKPYGPVFSTAPYNFKYRNKINLASFNLNPLEEDLDKREMAYISLGKSKSHSADSVYYSFDGNYFKDDEFHLPRPTKEVYGFLEVVVGNSPNFRGVINRLVLDMERQFYKRLNEALEYEEKSRYRSKK